MTIWTDSTGALRIQGDDDRLTPREAMLMRDALTRWLVNHGHEGLSVNQLYLAERGLDQTA